MNVTDHLDRLYSHASVFMTQLICTVPVNEHLPLPVPPLGSVTARGLLMCRMIRSIFFYYK